MELSKERINEIAYAILIAVLSKEEVELNPDKFKRELGNLSSKRGFIPKQFENIAAEELQMASKIIFHDLVDFAFGFEMKSKKISSKELDKAKEILDQIKK